MKEHTIHIRVSDRDLKQLDDTAERLGLSRSDLLRRCFSGDVLIKAAELELTRLLTREIAINGLAGSEPNKPEVMAEYKRIVRRKYPGLAAAADSGVINARGLRELFPQHLR